MVCHRTATVCRVMRMVVFRFIWWKKNSNCVKHLLKWWSNQHICVKWSFMGQWLSPQFLFKTKNYCYSSFSRTTQAIWTWATTQLCVTTPALDAGTVLMTRRSERYGTASSNPPMPTCCSTAARRSKSQRSTDSELCSHRRIHQGTRVQRLWSGFIKGFWFCRCNVHRRYCFTAFTEESHSGTVIWSSFNKYSRVVWGYIIVISEVVLEHKEIKSTRTSKKKTGYDLMLGYKTSTSPAVKPVASDLWSIQKSESKCSR